MKGNVGIVLKRLTPLSCRDHSPAPLSGCTRRFFPYVNCTADREGQTLPVFAPLALYGQWVASPVAKSRSSHSFHK